MVKNYRVHVNGKAYDVTVEETGSSSQTMGTVAVQPQQRTQTPAETVSTPVIAPQQKKETVKEKTPDSGSTGKVSIDAPMAGLVIDVFAKTGQRVGVGEKLLILEAMKMENDIVSDVSGIVDTVEVKKGDNVETGQIMVTIIKS